MVLLLVEVQLLQAQLPLVAAAAAQLAQLLPAQVPLAAAAAAQFAPGSSTSLEVKALGLAAGHFP